MLALSPSSYFRFADDTPTIVIRNLGSDGLSDSSGNKANGIIVNNVKGGGVFPRFNGPFNKLDRIKQNKSSLESFSMYFGGTGYVHVPYNEGNNPRGNFSVELWVKVNAEKPMGYIVTSGSVSLDVGYSLYVDSDKKFKFKIGSATLKSQLIEVMLS